MSNASWRPQVTRGERSLGAVLSLAGLAMAAFLLIASFLLRSHFSHVLHSCPTSGGYAYNAAGTPFWQQCGTAQNMVDISDVGIGAGALLLITSAVGAFATLVATGGSVRNRDSAQAESMEKPRQPLRAQTLFRWALGLLVAGIVLTVAGSLPWMALTGEGLVLLSAVVLFLGIWRRRRYP